MRLRILVFLYVAIFVALPLSAAVVQLSSMTAAEFFNAITRREAVSAIKLSAYAAVVAALINSFFGFLIAWSLTRYRFPLRRLVDALVDLPFAIPAVVAGVAFLDLYGRGSVIGKWMGPAGEFGKWLASNGWQPITLTGSFLGLVLANLFVTLPFVVRTVQPVIAEMDTDAEEAAASLGASPFTIFRRIVFPHLLPAIGAGFGLAFARGINEYGIATLISGNIPFESLLASVYIFQRLDAQDYNGATAVSLVLLSIALLALLVTYLWTRWSTRHGN